MPTHVITTDDLRDFKIELMELLNISSGTLQNLRINGTLPYTKMGGILFYDTEDIQAIMKKNRVDYDF